jgi:uncharacterized membrane protein YbaN (DUF454 family)
MRKNIKIWLWRALGIFFVGMAYIGAITPGIPTTFFALLAAWAFSKSSPKMDKWLHEHPIFGKYLNNWEQKRIYPNRGRLMMVVVMLISLITMAFTLPLKVVVYALITFSIIAVWAFRYPGSVEEYDKRIKEGKKIGWLK